MGLVHTASAILDYKLVEQQVDLPLHAKYIARLALLDLVIANSPPSIQAFPSLDAISCSDET